MKTSSKMILVLLGIIMTITVNAQDYKHSYGFVDKHGKITDSTGTHLGWITPSGVLQDNNKVTIAHVDLNGNLIDQKTGKSMGRAPKNGTFVYHFKESTDTLTIGAPQNGICEVKNVKGETVLMVHENYKQNGACAYHCLAMHKKGLYMKMK
jgi:hypothetical protein